MDLSSQLGSEKSALAEISTLEETVCWFVLAPRSQSVVPGFIVFKPVEGHDKEGHSTPDSQVGKEGGEARKRKESGGGRGRAGEVSSSGPSRQTRVHPQI